MANFHTHLTGAVSVGVIGSTILVASHLLPAHYFISTVALVAMAGILPDVDSDHSDSIKIIFDLLAISIATITALLLIPKLGAWYGLGLLAIVFLAIRFVFVWPFRHLTSHRGIFHSIPMGALFAAATTVTAYHYAHFSAQLAWLFGLAILTGFLTHLILDEIYSINLAGASLKKSFGTAFKFFSRKHLISYALLYAGTALLCYYLPPIKIAAIAQQLHALF